jgi:hypothetical protein
MDLIGKETIAFVRTCEDIHALFAIRPLTSEEQYLIEFSCGELLRKMKPA